MKEKIISILDHLVREGRGAGFETYKERSDGSFELQTRLSESDNKTLLKYEATGDNEMFRIEIMHIFGSVDVRIAPENAAGQLLRMLAHNTGSFSNTTAFIGITPGDTSGVFLATLNSFHHFVTSWNDADIARALYLHFFDIMMGLSTKDTSLTMLKLFGDNPLHP